MKTFVQVFKKKYSNADSNNFHGIGDFLRSTLGLYILSKKYNFNLVVDFSLHPIKEYIEYVENDYSILVKSNENNVKLLRENEIIDINNNNEEETILLFGWCGLSVYDTPLTEDAIVFMKNLIKPNKIMLDYINLKLLELPFTNFNIIQYRLGDTILFNNNNNNDKKEYNINEIIDNLDSETNNILLSDSCEFKEFVREKKLNIFIFDTKICHLGWYDNDMDVKDTLFEFFLITKASNIKSFSVYCWPSGFTYAISFIYKIPYESKVNLII
jgi:hypothetical protein